MRLRDDGVREITLLGQNVNSYHDRSEAATAVYKGTGYTTSAGFGNTFRSRGGAGAYFAELLAEVRVCDRSLEHVTCNCRVDTWTLFFACLSTYLALCCGTVFCHRRARPCKGLCRVDL